MRRVRRTLLTAIAVIVALPLAAIATTSGAKLVSATTTTTTPATTSTFTMAAPFNPGPAAVGGSTDVYHCSLIDPKVTQDSYITSDQINPDQTKEFHHAILFLVSPADVATATSLNASSGGNGWPCFGTPLNPAGSFDGTPWLGAWVPGHGPDTFPAGTGIPMPAGSMIVMQIHYNLLNGSTPDQSSVSITTTPQAGSSLKPLSLNPIVAPPDLPCPPGVTGTLCSRAASLTDLGNRFGSAAVGFVNGLEFICNHNYSAIKPSAKPITTTCTSSIGSNEVIRSITPHMHLIGQTQSVQLIHGTKTTSLIKVAHYSFDAQVTTNLAKPVVAHAGDQIKLTCGYDATLRQKLPSLRNLAPRYVTWGDGSTDEMCLTLLGSTPS